MTLSDEWLFLSLTLYVLIALGTLWYAVFLRKAHLLDPIVQFLMFLSLFVIPLPLRVLLTKAIEGDITDHLPHLLAYMPGAVLMTALSVPLFAWGYYSRFAKAVAVHLPQPKTGKHMYAPVLLLVAFSLFLLSQLARSQGGIFNFVLLGYGATSEMFGKGYLAIGFPWLWVASMFLLYRYAVRRKMLDLILFGVFFFLLFAIFLVMGSRNMIVYTILTAAVFWHHAVARLSMQRLFVVVIVCFAGLNIVGYLRTSKYQSLTEFWNKSVSAYDNTGGESGRVFYTLTTGEFVVPFETLPQMMRSVGSDVPPQFGLTYLKDALQWIPSVLFPSRPPTLTHWYMETFYDRDTGLNIGKSFFFLSEGYLNFGPLGIFFTMFVWGVFWGTVHCYLYTSQGEPGSILLCALTIAFIYRGIAGDFATMFVGLPEQSLSAAVIGIWIASVGTNKSPRKNRTPAIKGAANGSSYVTSPKIVTNHNHA
jgi:hypothetical protein